MPKPNIPFELWDHDCWSYDTLAGGQRGILSADDIIQSWPVTISKSYTTVRVKQIKSRRDYYADSKSNHDHPE